MSEEQPVKIENPEHSFSESSTKGFTLKPGQETTIKTCWGTTRVHIVNTSNQPGKFWFRAGIHPVEEHEILAQSSQTHNPWFGPLGAFLGNHGDVDLYFETSC
jgi:hypothetical protein